MVFSSLFFLFFFLPLNLTLYFVTKNERARNIILVVFSLFFYAWGEPIWVILLVFSASVDYIHGRVIERNRGQWKAKAALVSSIVINLGLLFSFKYVGFFSEIVNTLFELNIKVHEFSLPIGISFYTFQTLSYTIDVYKGEVSAQRSYIKFLLFVSLFHQLVAGPIVRYKDIAKEIDHRVLSARRFSDGINRFVIGLGKKVIFANTAGKMASSILDHPFDDLSVLGAWYAIFLFSLQIYYDFSGYSDMAIGLGRMFGFTYKENFNYPYIATSATEFWRRWHMSLGSFFRDYVYIPLGGNRHHHLRNLLIVWALTGLWHGASWNFVLWGLFYGLLILLEKLWLMKFLEKMPRFISHGYLLVIVMIGWTLFYFTDTRDMFSYIGIMSGLAHHPLLTKALLIQMANSMNFLLGAIFFATPIASYVYGRLSGKKQTFIGVTRVAINVLIVVVSVSLLIGETYNPFLYFRF